MLQGGTGMDWTEGHMSSPLFRWNQDKIAHSLNLEPSFLLKKHMEYAVAHLCELQVNFKCCCFLGPKENKD